jgi:hypothetical protein
MGTFQMLNSCLAYSLRASPELCMPQSPTKRAQNRRQAWKMAPSIVGTAPLGWWAWHLPANRPPFCHA